MSNLVTDKPTLNDYWEALICEGIDTWHWTRVLTRAPRHDDVRGEDWLRDEVLGLRHLHRHVADHAPATTPHINTWDTLMWKQMPSWQQQPRWIMLPRVAKPSEVLASFGHTRGLQRFEEHLQTGIRLTSLSICHLELIMWKRQLYKYA